jgi:hypothetical protein
MIATKPAKKSKAPKTAKTKEKTPVTDKPRLERAPRLMNFPCKSEITPPRAESKRGRLVEGLIAAKSKGLTGPEITQITGWEGPTLREGVRLIHSSDGYGIQEYEKDTFRILTK